MKPFPSGPSPILSVVGLGALTSIGQSPEAIAAAAAGGISRFRPAESFRHPGTGAAVTFAALSTVPPRTSVTDRLSWLGSRAAAHALASIRSARGAARVAALVSIPPPRPGPPPAAMAATARKVLERLDVPLVRPLCGFFNSGHEGGVAALDQARQILGAGKADFCLVGGVDSHRDADTLAWLAKERRLKDDETPHGFIPGEAAAFVLVTTRETARHLALTVRGRIVGVGRAIEPSPWYSGQSTQGRGLTEAIRIACAGLPAGQRASATYCDNNGEPWRSDEWSMAYIRTAAHHADPMDLRHPADCWGDVGAASATMLVATALVDIARGRTRGPRALLWCASSTRPHRGAVLVEGDQ